MEKILDTIHNVECPHCKAMPGERCRSAAGKRKRRLDTHMNRRIAALTPDDTFRFPIQHTRFLRRGKSYLL